MPNYGKEKEGEYIRRIKRLLVKDAGLSLREIQGMLESGGKPIRLDLHYIGKLVKKIRQERIYRMDYYRVKEWLASFEERVDEYKRYLWNVVTNPQAQDRDKIVAIRELRNSDVVLFDKMFDAGVFDRKIGEMTVKGRLDEGDKAFLDKALKFARFGYGNSIGRKDNRKDNNG